MYVFLRSRTVALLFFHSCHHHRVNTVRLSRVNTLYVPHHMRVLYVFDWRTGAALTGERKHHAGVGEYPVVGRERGAHPLPLPRQAVPRLEGGSGQAQGAQGEVLGQANQVCARNSELFKWRSVHVYVWGGWAGCGGLLENVFSCAAAIMVFDDRASLQRRRGGGKNRAGFECGKHE